MIDDRKPLGSFKAVTAVKKDEWERKTNISYYLF